MRLIDRYLIREIITPTALALVVFTFILQIPPVMEQAEGLIAKGVPWRTIVTILATLLPQALGITIPMALLVGLLMAFGRLSTDREAVALQACGVSIYRMLRPVIFVALVAWAATSYVMIVAMPEANQAFREITYNIVASRAENDVKSRVFFEDFPNLVFYVQEVPTDGSGWNEVFMADLRDAAKPVIFVAKHGRMVLNRERQKVDVELREGAVHRASGENAEEYEVERFETMTVALNPESVFKRAGLQRGVNEMTIADLQAQAELLQSQNLSPHPPLIALHRKFSIPVACFVFALIGLGLGVTSRKDGKQASFVIGIAVIFAYYIIMYGGEALAKGHWLSPAVAAWLPDMVLGTAALALVTWRSKSVERRLSLPRAFSWRTRRKPQEVVVAAPARSGRGKRVVVVIRVPQFSIPGPNLLDWYVGKIYVQVFAMAFVGLLGIFYIATFLDLSDKLFKGQTTGGMLVRYLWYATPQFVYYLTPIAALVATLVSIGLLTKSSELVVMRACGISLYRSALPLFLLGAVWSGLLFGMQERVLAPANREAAALRHVIRGGSPQTFDILNRRWLVSKAGDIYHYQGYDPNRRSLTGLSVYDIAPEQWTINARLFTARATYENPLWQGEAGWMRRFDGKDERGTYESFTGRRLELESDEYFNTEQPNADRMNYQQLKLYIGELRSSGFNVVPYAVALQRKLSFPFVTTIMTLIAVPFAVTTGKRGALYGIGVGIALAISYWLFFSVFAAIGTAGLITPPLAAWAPNILFAAAAAYLLLTVRT